MTGRITKLVDDRQSGIIAGEDGDDYAFRGSSLVGTSFGGLHVGAAVTFTPIRLFSPHRATAVRLSST